MSPRWMSSLIRARQYQEDDARAKLATAERLASRAHARVKYDEDRLESLRDADAEDTVPSFIAAAVALQAAAATHAAAVSAAEQADVEITQRRNQLTDAAVHRRSAEELAARAAATERAKAAAAAQRSQDEIAAAVHRRNGEQTPSSPDGPGGAP